MLSVDQMIDRLLAGGPLDIADVRTIRKTAKRETWAAMQRADGEGFAEWAPVFNAADDYLIAHEGGKDATG